MTTLSRRDLVNTLALGAAAIALPLRAADAVKLDPRDPAAVALGYVERAERVDQKKYPGYIAGSSCANCLQLQGKPGDEYRPCTLFKGKLVAASGWCSSWAAEM